MARRNIANVFNLALTASAFCHQGPRLSLLGKPIGLDKNAHIVRRLVSGFVVALSSKSKTARRFIRGGLLVAGGVDTQRAPHRPRQ